MPALPDHMHAPGDPWLSKQGEPLPPTQQALLDAVLAADLTGVNNAMTHGANPVFPVWRSQDKDCASTLTLAACHHPSLATQMISTLCRTVLANRRELLQHFLVHARPQCTDAMLGWFLGHLGDLDMSTRASCWRALTIRGRWSVLMTHREQLWGWESVHTGVNAYTASFVWSRALLSVDPRAQDVQAWIQEVILRFEAADPGTCKTLLDEICLCVDQHPAQHSRPRVVRGLANLLRAGSGVDKMAGGTINLSVGIMLQEAIALLAAEGCAQDLERSTPAAAGGGSRQGRL